MAKIKLGAIVVDMRGKLGGHVFAQNKGGNYVRTKTTPSNPQTAEQSFVRVLFASISVGWSGLTEAGRDSFNSLVSAYAKTNVFGDLKNPSGKALYQRLNQNLGLTGQTLITSCVNPTPLVGASGIVGTGIVSTQAITIATNGNTTGNVIMVFATPPMSQGTKFVKNKLRFLSDYPGDADKEIDFTTAWTNKYGAFALGDNIVIGVKTINPNGQATPLEISKLEIVATP